MTEEFLAGVRSIVEPLLIQLGFQLEEFGDVDESGRKCSVVFFRSNDCKIQVYDVPREGEINIMIAPLDAANVFSLYDRSGKWQSLPRFAIRQGVPLEDIMKDDKLPEFLTTNQFLESVRDRIKKYFPSRTPAFSKWTDQSGGHRVRENVRARPRNETADNERD
jgi:hypothetical protein